MPVRLADPITWRSLVNSINLQGGHYALPTEPLYPWDKYEDIFARSMKNIAMMQARDHSVNSAELPETDDSRLFVYRVIEKYLDLQNSGTGQACLLRSICENAQIHLHVGMYSEILNLILT